jgi:glycosyltransferase involved in cell wall biosynthesis
MDLSIVLCTWNNARRLAVTLDAISRCRVPPTLRWELVLVANNCTDATVDVARGFGGRLPLHHLVEPRQGLSHARVARVAASSSLPTTTSRRVSIGSRPTGSRTGNGRRDTTSEDR